MKAFKQDKEKAKETVRQHQKELRGNERELQREIAALKLEETKILADVKRYAKRGDDAMAKTLAKSVVRNRQQQQRLTQTQLQMRSTSHMVKTHAATATVASAMGAAGAAMASINAANDPEKVAQTIMEFQQAAQKMDMTDDMLASALDGMDDAEVDELADLEVDKVVEETLLGLKSTNAPSSAIAQRQGAATTEDQQAEELLQRMNVLRQ